MCISCHVTSPNFPLKQWISHAKPTWKFTVCNDGSGLIYLCPWSIVFTSSSILQQLFGFLFLFVLPCSHIASVVYYAQMNYIQLSNLHEMTWIYDHYYFLSVDLILAKQKILSFQRDHCLVYQFVCFLSFFGLFPAGLWGLLDNWDNTAVLVIIWPSQQMQWFKNNKE